MHTTSLYGVPDVAAATGQPDPRKSRRLDGPTGASKFVADLKVLQSTLPPPQLKDCHQK